MKQRKLQGRGPRYVERPQTPVEPPFVMPDGDQYKVTYWTPQGYLSKAYVVFVDGFAIGTNKHTDEPVRLQWIDPTGWIEIA